MDMELVSGHLPAASFLLSHMEAAIAAMQPKNLSCELTENACISFCWGPCAACARVGACRQWIWHPV